MGAKIILSLKGNLFLKLYFLFSFIFLLQRKRRRGANCVYVVNPLPNIDFQEVEVLNNAMWIQCSAVSE